MAEPGKPTAFMSPMAPSTAIGRYSCRNPEGVGTNIPALSESEHHRRLWLQHALQTPQPVRLPPQPE